MRQEPGRQGTGGLRVLALPQENGCEAEKALLAVQHARKGMGPRLLFNARCQPQPGAASGANPGPLASGASPGPETLWAGLRGQALSTVTTNLGQHSADLAQSQAVPQDLT